MAIHKVKLTYNVTEKKLTSDIKTKSISNGDSLEFFSDDGDVRVEMIPAGKFSAAEFRTKDTPVIIRTLDPFSVCCGVTINGKVIGYPVTREYGDTGVPKDGGGGS